MYNDTPIELSLMVHKLIESLDKLRQGRDEPYSFDEGDVGNEIGIIIAQCLDNESIDIFLNGIEHGISLTQGSHDSDEIPMFRIFTEVDTPEERENIKEREKGILWETGVFEGNKPTVPDNNFNNLVGMSEKEAAGYLISHDYFLNIGTKDGVHYISTCELNPKRVTVDIENDIITKVHGVG